MKVVQRVVHRFIQAMAKSDFETRLLRTLEDLPGAIDEGILEGENAVQRRHQNDPYESIEEFKRYDLEGYQRALERAKGSLLRRLGRITWGKTGPLVYRALKVTNPEAFIESLKSGTTRVGIYWTFSRGKAIPYWAKSPDQKTVILEGELPPESIDFAQLIRANTTRAFSQDEDEITALANRPVFILRGYFDAQVVDVNQLNRS